VPRTDLYFAGTIPQPFPFGYRSEQARGSATGIIFSYIVLGVINQGLSIERGKEKSPSP